MSVEMTDTACCRRCGHEITLGDGWRLLGLLVECEACFTLNEIHVDEDADCNFWFVGDAP